MNIKNKLKEVEEGLKILMYFYAEDVFDNKKEREYSKIIEKNGGILAFIANIKEKLNEVYEEL